MLPVYTIGHSTRTDDELIELLRQHGVERLVDIRTVPRSRTNPQFNRETLPAVLASRGMDYQHVSDLGGLRPKATDSTSGGWRNASFRNYADYMRTEAFRAALAALAADSQQVPTAIMCAEAVPWRCHRSLVGDALEARGIPVVDIISATSAPRHRMTPFAVLDGDRVTYPEPQSD